MILKIMIVDDEPFFLDTIKTFFNTNIKNAEVAATALNGCQAIELLHKTHVDVVITDIQMPLMDGFDLILNASALFPALQFVVLSAYSDYPTVKKAFKLGTVEYLLKPEITAAEFSDILEKCRKKILKTIEDEEEKKLRQEKIQLMIDRLDTLEKYHYATRQTILNTCINKLIENVPEYESLLILPEAVDIRLLKNPGTLILIRIDNYYKITGVMQKNEEMFEYALDNVFNETLSGCADLVIAKRNKTDYIILVQTCQQKIIDDIIDRLRNNFKKSLHVDLIIAASIGDNKTNSPAQLYSQASNAMQWFFINGKTAVHYYDNRINKNSDIQLFKQQLYQLSNNYQGFLTSGNIEKIQDSINEYTVFKIIPDTEFISEIRALFERYFVYLTDYYHLVPQNANVEKKLQEYGGYLRDFGTMKEHIRWHREMISLLIQNDMKTTSLIRQAKRYIMANYAEDISLKSLSKILIVTPNYLSRVLTKSTGMGFSKYLNSARIQAAVELMEKSNLKLYEIAYKVGYQNVEHFSRIFKKQMGKSPRQYINQRG